MQTRQTDRARYFRELADTSQRHFIPYLSAFTRIESGMNVLEIGCGEGGNLLPFARMGCRVTGVDLASGKIANARLFFDEAGAEGRFIDSDIFALRELEETFDLVICHDVLEHIGDKRGFLSGLARYLKPDGIVFMAFPAWQMPFGGHQQICKSKVLSRFPFIHLLPAPVYKSMLKSAGEKEGCITELLEIKQTRTPIELFEKLLHEYNAELLDRKLWFINPHYEVKFGLKPRKLPAFLGKIPWLRNFFTTSCFYVFRFR